MIKSHKTEIITLAAFVMIGQLLFWPLSGFYAQTRYESRIFATNGAWFDSADLHKLNEGAFYFGQTMIGWTKFPHFRESLADFAQLPADTQVNMRLQERQNIILTLTTQEPIVLEQLEKAKEFLQTQMDDYNRKTNTQFILTNVDYDLTTIQRSVFTGAGLMFILSLVLAGAFLTLKKEFFPPKLKFK